jgi:hypothetical protein
MPKVSRVPVTVSYKGKRIPISDYIDKEHEAFRLETHRFQQKFGRLESSLSRLLHAILDANGSRIPDAIYYSIISFDARASMVGNALLEAITENADLAPLSKQTCWPYIFDKIDKTRKPFRRRVRIALRPEIADMVGEVRSEHRPHLLGIRPQRQSRREDGDELVLRCRREISRRRHGCARSSCRPLAAVLAMRARSPARPAVPRCSAARCCRRSDRSSAAGSRHSSRLG